MAEKTVVAGKNDISESITNSEVFSATNDTLARQTDWNHRVTNEDFMTTLKIGSNLLKGQSNYFNREGFCDFK
jgi:hypothetical protein